MSLELVLKLKRRLDAKKTLAARLDDYFTGDQPLSYLHPDIGDAARRRLTPLVINWPRVIVSSIEERLDVEGFRLAKATEGDDRLWDWWQANDLDEFSQMGHEDAMVHSHAFISVWAGDRPDIPRIAVESAAQVTCQFKPGTRELEAALKVWSESEDAATPGPSFAVLYLPDRIEKWTSAGVSAWKRAGEDIPNPLGVVPVVPLVNRPRLTKLLGESELSDIIPIADAVNKLATDMMTSSEYHAMPRRWATGMETPRANNPQQDERFTEEIKQKWSEAMPGKPWIGGMGVAFGQFTEATLDNFINAVKMLEGAIAAIAGLPPHYLGVNSDNPASADAIRSAEASLVKKALRKQRAFGGGWERAMRLAVAVADGVAPQSLDRLETIWRDPSTPTPAQKADATVKLTQGDRPIITLRQAREDLDYTPTQIDRMEADEAAAVAQAATDVRAKVEEAQRLQAEQGLSPAASFAAVGLLVAAQQMSADATPPAA